MMAGLPANEPVGQRAEQADISAIRQARAPHLSKAFRTAAKPVADPPPIG